MTANQLELALSPEKTPIKKTFVTQWSRSSVMVVDRLSFQELQFFDHAREYNSSVVREMIHPDSIRFNDLNPFFGKKTRITIEVIE